MRRIWITGAGGLVGKTLCSKIDAIATSRELDIADLSAVRAFAKKNGPLTHIINCAAFSEVDPAESAIEAAFRTNAVGPENLGRLALEIGAHLIHLSTDYVFDAKKGSPLKEDDHPEPCNVYGKTKLEGEKRLFSVFPKACVLRTSWIFGAEGKNFVAKLLPLLETKDELRLVFDQTSRPTYVFDLANAIIELLDDSGLYHFANREPTNKYEFSLSFREIAEEMGFAIRCKTIVPVASSEFSSPAKRPLYSALHTGKIEKRLGSPIRPWKDCIREYLNEKTR
jgi:dTDP-4-dehydrorhamnose reductase